MLLRRRKQQADSATMESFSAVVEKSTPPAYEHGVNDFDTNCMTNASPTRGLISKPGVPTNQSDVKRSFTKVEDKIKTTRVGEPIYVKINLRLNRQHLPKEENLEFIDFSKKDGYPVFKFWGDVGYLANLYPIEELIQTTIKTKTQN